MTAKKAPIPQSGKQSTHPLLATLSLALAGTLWGTGFFFGKIAFEEMTLSENIAFRFVFGALALLPVLFVRKEKLTARAFWLIAFAGVIAVPVQFFVQYKGLEMTTVSHASLMVGTLPMLLGLSSVVFIHEHLTWLEWGALLFSALGAVLIAVSRSSANGPQPSAMGDFLVFLSMLFAVVTILVTKHLVRRYDPLYVTALMIVLGTLFLLAWFVATQPIRMHFSHRTWIAVAAQGILATTLAFLFWNWGIAHVSASRAGVFLNMEPLVGALLGVLILKETLGRLAIVGGAMILSSAAYFTRVHREQQKQESPSAQVFAGEGAEE